MSNLIWFRTASVAALLGKTAGLRGNASGRMQSRRCIVRVHLLSHETWCLFISGLVFPAQLAFRVPASVF